MNDPTPSNTRISARKVLLATQELQRYGHRRQIERMEQSQPHLAEFLLEELSQLHRALLNAGLDARTTRKLYRRAQALTLTCIRACELGITR